MISFLIILKANFSKKLSEIFKKGNISLISFYFNSIIFSYYFNHRSRNIQIIIGILIGKKFKNILIINTFFTITIAFISFYFRWIIAINFINNIYFICRSKTSRNIKKYTCLHNKFIVKEILIKIILIFMIFRSLFSSC